MFSFFRRKPKEVTPPSEETSAAPAEEGSASTPSPDIIEVREDGALVFAPLEPTSKQEPAPAPETELKPEPEPEPEPEPIQSTPIISETEESVDEDALTEEALAASPPEEESEEVEIVPAAPPTEVKQSWFARLKTGLSKTSNNLTTLFVGAKIDDDLYDELEAALLQADAGVEATQSLLNSLKKRVKEKRLTDASQVRTALRGLLVELLTPLQKPLVLGRHQPMVMMIAGVNGAGKTTTIGKLAKHMQAHDQSVLLAAGDTFRAAAREQLTVWGERNQVTVISQQSGDPAAVAFDAVQAAKARKNDVVMVDTAGRLPTQLHLMDELKKVKRVIGKGMEGAPHEILLVIDGNTGQNAVAQVKAFDDALGLTGLIVTKLDGTAKGGVLAAIVKARPIPVYFIGVGEKIEDLQPFDAEAFADALLGEPA
jgi:fused signal recognition particle receptor